MALKRPHEPTRTQPCFDSRTVSGQAFDYARSKAGNVSELFDVLAGKLRRGRQSLNEDDGLQGTSSSSKSILKAEYYGSAGSTVLGKANLKRIQTFLDEPQKHLGQVMGGGIGCWAVPSVRTMRTSIPQGSCYCCFHCVAMEEEILVTQRAVPPAR